MWRYKYVSQIDMRDCGVAALASVAKHYGSHFSLAHLRELAKTSKEGTTALGIVEAAKKIGFETRAIQANMELFEMPDIPYPCIVHVLTYIVLASLLVTIINIVGSYYLQGILDEYIPNQLQSTLNIVSIGLVVTYIMQQIMNFSQQYLLVVLSQRLTIDVILSYIRHIFELPMSFFATRRTGEVISRFTDANSIIDALASTILSIFLDVSILIIVGSVLILQNAKLFFLTLVALPIYAIIIFAFMKPFERMNHDVMQANSMVSSAIIEDINGIETIKSLTSEETRYRNIDSEFVGYLDKSFTLSKYEAIQTSLKQGAQLILNVAILW